MMGTHHALCGAAAWVALTSTAPGFPAISAAPIAPEYVVMGAVLCAGAALLPDLDHPSATIAHAIPGVGRAATGAISGLAGGHRRGTHSLLAAAGIVLLASLPFTLPALLAGACGAALLAFALRVLGLRGGWPAAWALGAAAALGIGALTPGLWALLGPIVLVGWITHLAGDILTRGGLPLLWPLRPRAPRALRRVPVLRALWLRSGNFALPILGRTGSRREWALLLPIGAYALIGVCINLPLIIGG